VDFQAVLLCGFDVLTGVLFLVAAWALVVSSPSSPFCAPAILRGSGVMVGLCGIAYVFEGFSHVSHVGEQAHVVSGPAILLLSSLYLVRLMKGLAHGL
jgi:amino acid transporter